MKRVNAITFLNYFVSGAVTLLIPLLLLARNVSLAEIGVVLSVMPLIFLVARMLFAAIADYIGWSHVFLLINWPATFASVSIYYFATSLPVFVAGKLVEGIRESSYWAVSRTAIIHLSPKREGNEATKNNAIIWLASAAGAVVAGLGIAYVGFASTLAVLMFASLGLGVPAVLLWKNSKKIPMPKTQRIFASLDPRGRPRVFWQVSIALVFNTLALYPLIMLLLPAFMNQKLEYNYTAIGILFMLYNLVSAIVAFLTLKKPLNFVRAVVLTVASVLASSLLANSGMFFPAFFLILAAVRGYGIGFFEHAIIKVARDSKTLSVDIGFLHAPMRIAEFASVLAAGFLAQTVGYAPIFAVTGVFFGVFLFICLHVLKSRQVPI